MRKRILYLAVIGLFFTQASKGQIFSVPLDTVFSYLSGPGSISDNITNVSSKSIQINWRVDTTNFPPDWLTPAAFGICDNSGCYNNVSDMQLWNDTTNSGKGFATAPIAPDSTALFYLSMDLSGASLGAYYAKIKLTDVSSYSSKIITFIVDNTPAGVTITKSLDDVTLYPNPASDKVNVLYSADARVKNIAIYNIIGKTMAVYWLTANNSAGLNVENIPAGIYFIRLLNTDGGIVATRKFTKQ